MRRLTFKMPMTQSQCLAHGGGSLAVAEGHLDLASACDHMRVGKDIAARVEDDAGTRPLPGLTSAGNFRRDGHNARRCLLVERGGRHWLRRDRVARG